MQKTWIKLSLISGLLMLWSAQARAELSIPVPAQKPAAERKGPGIPVPALKPAIATNKDIQDIKAEAVSLISGPQGALADAKPLKYDYTRYNLNRALAGHDIDIYKQIFLAQGEGDFEKADNLIKSLGDTRLLGHVLYERYVHKDYKSSYSELQAWMQHYPDHPGADDIYALARRKGPAEGDSGELIKPEKLKIMAVVREPTIQWGKRYRSSKERTADQRQSIYALNREFTRKVKKGEHTQVLGLLNNDPRAALMDKTEKDIVRSSIAVAYYYRGDADSAMKIAQSTLKRSGEAVPQSAWVAGLVSWRKGQYKNAARYFEIAGGSPYSSGWTAAAGSFWAARSHMKDGNYKEVSTWLERAYEHPRTFYGLLATRALGKDFTFNWSLPDLGQSHNAILSSVPAGARAIALVQSGRRDLAEKELLRVDAGQKPQLSEAMMVFAQHARMPTLSVRLGNSLSSEETGFFDAALYPAGPWKPHSGYSLDPSLIYAIMRQESHFNPDAKSPSGAVGLMQVMPATARGMGLEKDQDLADPSVNMGIAQSYIEHLFKDKVVGGDLVRMLVAYNAGPGNLYKWHKQIPDINDPLFFIESVPVAETRAYVERVLSNYWIYQRRQGLETASLDELAQGKWAAYPKMQKMQTFETASSQ